MPKQKWADSYQGLEMPAPSKNLEILFARAIALQIVRKHQVSAFAVVRQASPAVLPGEQGANWEQANLGQEDASKKCFKNTLTLG
jgi:hypothetical protein